MTERPEGLVRLIQAAKYLAKQWDSRNDINDKLAYDRLIWLITEFNDVEFNSEFLEAV